MQKGNITLANLSINSQRKKRAQLALVNKTSFDKKAYQKKRYKAIKKNNEELKGWFK